MQFFAIFYITTFIALNITFALCANRVLSKCRNIDTIQNRVTFIYKTLGSLTLKSFKYLDEISDEHDRDAVSFLKKLLVLCHLYGLVFVIYVVVKMAAIVK